MSETYLPAGAIGRPRTDREPITVRLGRKQRRWVDAQALAAQCGRSEIIRQLVQAAMDAENAEVTHAPDLLEALEELLFSVTCHGPAEQVRQYQADARSKARAAIAKARGQVQAAMDADEAEDRQMSAELQRCEP